MSNHSCFYKKQGVVALYAGSVENLDISVEEFAKLLEIDPECRGYYEVPYATEFGPIALRDTVVQLEWASQYLMAISVFMFALRLEDGTCIPATTEVLNAVWD